MTTDEDRQVYLATHWTMHRLAAKGQMPYPESCLIEDEWIGRPPPEAVAAIDRGEPDLTLWCPTLRPGIVD